MVPRPATPADVDALVALINRAFEPESAFITGDRIDAAEVRELMTRGTFLVIDDADRPIGSIYTAVVDGRGYLGLLSVAPDRQRGGLGRRLVAAAEDRARAAGCAAMDLKVVDLRDELPPYYRALGYQAIGTEPFPADAAAKLLRPCHFIVMSRSL